MQEVLGSIPRWDATFSGAPWKGCRWLWSPLHCGDPDVMRNSHAATCIRSDLHASLQATESHSATIPHRNLGGSCSSRCWDPEGQLNKPLEWLFAVQEVPSLIPRWDATFSEALWKGCRLQFWYKKWLEICFNYRILKFLVKYLDLVTGSVFGFAKKNDCL